MVAAACSRGSDADRCRFVPGFRYTNQMSDELTGTLADGTRPATPEDLFQRLRGLGIEYETAHHPPVFTVEEAQAVRAEMIGGHTKNLFLRNKKGRMWLLVCEEERRLDLKEVGRRLEAGRLSFGRPERLMQYLGVIPGAVSPFAVINDKEGQVRLVFERSLLEIPELNFHPLDNSMTTRLATPDVIRFLEDVGHAPALVDLS